MKPLANAVASVMAKIVTNGVPLRDLMALPDHGDAPVKRHMANELRRAAETIDRDAPSFGADIRHQAAGLLRTIASECDRRAIELDRDAGTYVLTPKKIEGAKVYVRAPQTEAVA